MAGNIGVELNLAFGEINCLLPNLFHQHFNKCEAPTYTYSKHIFNSMSLEHVLLQVFKTNQFNKGDG